MQTVEKFLFLRTDTNAYGVVSSLSTAKRRVLPFFAVHHHVLVSASDRFAHTPPCTRESCIYSKSERAATRFSLTRSLHFISRTRLLDTSRRTFFFRSFPQSEFEEKSEQRCYQPKKCCFVCFVQSRLSSISLSTVCCVVAASLSERGSSCCLFLRSRGIWRGEMECCDRYRLLCVRDGLLFYFCSHLPFRICFLVRSLQIVNCLLIDETCSATLG